MLLIEDVKLEDDNTPTGGKAYEGEMLSDFLGATESTSLDKINEELKTCGLKPITLEQVIITGVQGQ